MALYDNIYDVDFDRLALEGLPAFKRKPRLYRIVLSLITPVKRLYSEFLLYRRGVLYKIEHTPQVYSMENVLNDAYDDVLRRIYIEDGVYRDPLYIYRRNEDQPVRIYKRSEDQPVYIYRRSELANLDVDFVVVLPLDLMSLTDAELLRLRSLVDFYRLPDKTYTIRYE